MHEIRGLRFKLPPTESYRMIGSCALIYIVYMHIEIHVLLKHLSLFLISDYESNILILYNNFQILKALIINMVIFINYLT